MDIHASAARKWLVTTALSFLGTPYRWGGDDPSGFDCSGLVGEALRAAGLISSEDLSADGLLQKFSSCRVDEPGEGVLVFRINADGRAGHVGVCLDKWYMIEAGGGDQRVGSEDEAWRRNAFVRIRPIPTDKPARRFCDPILTTKE